MNASVCGLTNLFGKVSTTGSGERVSPYESDKNEKSVDSFGKHFAFGDESLLPKRVVLGGNK